MHVFHLVRSLGVNRPASDALSLLCCLVQVSDPRWQLSFLQRVCIYVDLLCVLVRACVIDDLLVEPLLILLDRVLMLSLEPHLHLPVGLRDQLTQLTYVLAMRNHDFVLIKLIGEGFLELLQTMLLRPLIECPQQLCVLLSYLLHLGVALQLTSR